MDKTTKCAGCGMEIKDQQKAVQREGKTYCSSMCADNAAQKR